MPARADRHPSEPIDPDVDLRLERAAGIARREAPVLAVIAAGGVAGSLARYGAGVLWPTPDGGFPWTTLVVNVVGCLLIGVLVVLTAEVFAAHPLVRPALGTGVLGGFTTFSAYAVDVQRLLADGRSATALAYLALTVLAAGAAVTVGTLGTRRAFARHAKTGPAETGPAEAGLAETGPAEAQR